ncbi:Exonuclease SbcC [Vibrio chagasii]|nr:NINE protein [Vibrio vulnificus]CAH7201251.1 Exonuclease SbcC [Vibrio chagasii]CAH7297175.1 Exonuclease SbcC [Vibrio chagasii]CAH7421060.1 Exonuclease SbcC [Vibrio chagasii]CAH7450047.1 Exonuclease SbcC [Vibrio chagasii]
MLVSCHSCKAKIDSNAYTCPRCGAAGGGKRREESAQRSAEARARKQAKRAQEQRAFQAEVNTVVSRYAQNREHYQSESKELNREVQRLCSDLQRATEKIERRKESLHRNSEKLQKLLSFIDEQVSLGADPVVVSEKRFEASNLSDYISDLKVEIEQLTTAQDPLHSRIEEVNGMIRLNQENQDLAQSALNDAMNGGAEVEVKRQKITDKGITRNKTLTALVFGGFFGLHRFYTGHYLIGLICLCTFGGYGMILLWDLVRLIRRTYTHSNGVVLT